MYKEQVLEPMLNGTEKTPALISDYKEYHTDTTVKFVVKMTEEKLAQAEAAGLHKVFKLQTSLTCNSMVTFLCLAIRILTVACCKLECFCSDFGMTEQISLHICCWQKVIVNCLNSFILEIMQVLLFWQCWATWVLKLYWNCLEF